MTSTARSGWRRFWDDGRWWRAALAVVGYLAFYTLASQAVVSVAGALIDRDDLFATPASVFTGLGAPLALGAVALLAFTASLRRLRPLFTRQPVPGRWWMWFFVALVILPIALRAAGIDYGAYAPGVVATTLLVGVLVGFTEELLYRGIVVDILRSAGHRERTVALLSTAFFALSHSVNLISGQPVLTVAIIVAFTFGFGMMMYLVLRATGNLLWPMLLHALTDPTTMLAAGGVDSTGAGAAHSPLIEIASPFNIVFIAAALIALIVIRGRAAPRPATAA